MIEVWSLTEENFHLGSQFTASSLKFKVNVTMFGFADIFLKTASIFFSEQVGPDLLVKKTFFLIVFSDDFVALSLIV